MRILYKFLALLLFIVLLTSGLQAQIDTLYIVKAVFFDSQGTGRSNTLEIEFSQPVDDSSLEDDDEKADWKVSNDINFVSNVFAILSFETEVDHIANSNEANDKYIRINFSNGTALGMANDTYTPVYLRYLDQSGPDEVYAFYDNTKILQNSTIIKAEDYAGPAVTSITFSPDNGILKINSLLNVSFTVSDSITYTGASILVNNKDVTSSIAAIDPFTFEVEYTVEIGDDDISVTDSVPVYISLLDTALNQGIIYTNSPPGSTPGIDAHKPSVSGVYFSPGSGTIVGIDSTINVTITATDLEPDLSPNSIIINGVTILNGDVSIVGDGTYTFNYSVSAGDGSVLDSEKIDIAFIFDDQAGNTSLTFTTSTDAGCPGIDDTAPSALSVLLSPNSGTLGIGDTILYTITAGEDGLVPSTILINGKNLINKYTAIGSNKYEIEYVIKSGDTNIPDASAIPINIVLKDAAGNPVTFNTLAAGDCPGIDASRPVISGVTFSPLSGNVSAIDEIITITITASESNLIADSISVNGKGLAIAGTGPYTISYTIAEGDNDIPDSSPIPIYFTLSDGVNISLPFKTTNIIADNCPGIDANRPEIVSASFSPGSGKTLGIDSVLTVTFEAKNLETGLSASTMEVNGQDVLASFAALGGSPGYYTVEYTVVSGDGSINDLTQAIPISFVLSDNENLTLPAFINSTITGTPGIDDTAPAALSILLSPNTGTLGIGDTILYTITAGEDGLVPSTILINGKNLINKYTAIGSNKYEIEYVIKSGDTNIPDASAIPINIVLKDAAGNPVTFNSLTASECPGIDVVKPVINLVTVNPVTMIYGQTYTVEINVDVDGGDLYNLESGTIAGFNFHTLTRNSSTSYSLKFTVGNLGYDILPGDSYSISNLVFSDRGDNFSSPYSAVITQAGDPIYTILPTAKVTSSHYVCDGDDADLSFQLTGNAPWSVELDNGTGTATIGGITESPFTYSVEQNLSISTEPDTIVYKITQVTDANGNIKVMAGTDSSTVYVRVVPFVTFDNPVGDKTYNVAAPQDSLEGTPSGGVFSGQGVIPSSNKFSPKDAGIGGPYEITYTYTNNITGCYNSASVDLTVVETDAYFEFFDPDDKWQCDYNSTFIVYGGIIDKPTIDGVVKLHGHQDAITEIDSKTDSVTVDVQKLDAGTYTLYYVYDDSGIDSISNSFTVESVGKPNFTELNDVCEDYETINVTAYNLIPAGGTGQFTFSSPVAGAFVSDPSNNNNSGYFAPGLITPGSYTLEYIYTSPNGCESEMVPKTFDVNALPPVSFTMNSVYNIDQGPSTIVGNPTNANGIFTPLSFMSNNGDGTADFDPADAGLGEHWVKYTYQDANSCVNADSMEITVNKALGSIASSTGSFQFCYYGSAVATFTGTPNPTDGTPGSFYIDDILVTPSSDNKILFNPQNYTAGDHEVKFEYSNGTTDYVVYKTVNVDLIGNIYFTGLDPKYCKNENVEIELTAFYPGQNGVMKFTGTGITDDVVDELGYFNPSKANLGENIINYKFTRDYSGCQKVYSESVTINRTPIVAFTPNERCIVNANDLLGFKAVDHPEDSIAKWTWLLKNQIQSNDTFPTFSIVPGTYNSMRLTLETNKGCTHFVDSTFYIGTRVDLQFTFENECNGEVSEFNVKVSSNSDDISYVNWDFGGPGVSDLSDSLNPTHKYSNPGGYEVIYEEFTKSCGRIADTMKVNIRPSIDLSTGKYIADFEDNPDLTGWVIEEYVSGVNNPWQWGEPSGTKIYSAPSGTNVFGTNLSGNYANNEKGMVTSPCFDFSSLQRPMMKMDFIADLEPDRDGVVMQYTKANGDWATIGVPNDGVNWYNSYIIGGAPADQQLGWTGNYSSLDNSGWVTAMYRLDELRGRAGVRFRLVFGSDLAGDNYEGFAFDNIQFSERERMVLLENFTNSSNDKANNTQVNTIDPILEKDSLDVISLNYHTSFPTADGFNSFYPSGPSARALFYGVSSIPYSILDGGERNYDYSPTNTLVESDVHKRVLIDPQFDISVKQDIQGNNLVVSSTVNALEELTEQNLIIYVAVVERTVIEGSKIFHNVLRTMLPDAAGILVERDWMVDDEYKLYHTWSIPEYVNEDSLITIVFVQNEDSKDIYQTSYADEFTTITAIDDFDETIASYEYKIYPNPVNNILSLQLLKTLAYPIEINVYNGVGVLVKTGKLMPGENLIQFDTNDIPAGVYYLKLTNSDMYFGTNKFVKTE